jgi:hypothetical protein
MSTELAWVTNHPLPVVPALINGRSANLMLDTGAGETVLDARFAVDVGVRLGGQEQRTFGGGMPAWVTYGHAKELLLGDLGVLDVPVHVIDMPPGLAGWFPDLPIHGILGTGVFSRFRTTLDYRSGCLRLESSDKTRDSQLQKIRQDRSGTPMWLAENQLPLACADLPAHENGVWFLDSGMTGGAFAVPASKVEALGLDAEKDAPLVGAGGGGTVQGHRVRTGWLRLDGLCRYHQEGVVLDNFPVEQSCGFAIQGLIGHDLLRNSVMTLDFPVMRLFLNEGNP